MKLKEQIWQKLTLSPTKDSSPTNATPKRWVTFTYYNPIIWKLIHLFRNTNLQIAFRTNNIIHNILHNWPHNTNLHGQNGICQLKCHTCSLSYLGQISRRLELRSKEHIRYTTSNNPQTAYALLSYKTHTNMDLWKPLWPCYTPHKKVNVRTRCKIITFITFTKTIWL